MNINTGELMRLKNTEETPNDVVMLSKSEVERLKKETQRLLADGKPVFLDENDRLRRDITIRNHVDKNYPDLNRKQKRSKVSEIKKNWKGKK